MNSCFFVGEMIEEPQLRPHNDVNHLFFDLKVEEIKKGKSTWEILRFEAWDSGAKAIADHCHKGDFIVVNCSAKNRGDDDIIFRVNSFKIFGYEVVDE